MKTVKNRALYYCDVVRRCVTHYHGVTRGGRNFKSCSHIDPGTCSQCRIYSASLKIITELYEKEDNCIKKG